MRSTDPRAWPGLDPWPRPGDALAWRYVRPVDVLSGLLDAVAAGDAGPRDGLVAVLNGLLGDHLRRAEHALATAAHLRQAGRPLDVAAPGLAARPRVLLMLHDLCLDESSWQREGHDHGRLLGQTLGATVLHLRYNSGLHVSDNGQALHQALDALVRDWPVTLQALDIVGHGMGGLVARSACAQAAQAGARWLAPLRRMVFLGTPHQGLPLERMRPWLRRVLGLRSASAPLARLAQRHSAGMADLRHGNLLAQDWQGHDVDDPRDHRQCVPLPTGVACHAIAGCLGAPAQAARRGDGLVPLASALGQHPRAGLALAPEACWVGEGLNHLDLLSSALVYRRLLYALSDG